MKLFQTLLLCASLTLATCAQAQTSDFVELIPTPMLQKDLTAYVGAGIVNLPKYADGSKQEFLPLPILDLEWKSGVFFGSQTGYGYNFSQSPGFQYGVRIGLIMDQQQSAKNNANGPGNTRTDVSPSAFWNMWISHELTILTAVNSGGGINKQHDGTTVSAGIRYFDQIGELDRVKAILSATWANQHYMQDYYGVSSQQSAEFNVPEWSASAGMMNAKVSFTWYHKLNAKWTAVTGGWITHPYGAASDSPLTSDKNLVTVFTGAYYAF